MPSFAEKVASEIPLEVRMISGCHDAQTSADTNITSFQLPNPAGRAEGACTAALLQVLHPITMTRAGWKFCGARERIEMSKGSSMWHQIVAGLSKYENSRK